MIGKCNKCGYQAGIVNLKNGICKSCLNKDINKNVQKRNFIFRLFVISLTVIYVAILLLFFIVGSTLEGTQLNAALGVGLTSPFTTSIIVLILSPNTLVAKILRIYAMTTIIIFIIVNLLVYISPSSAGFYSWPYIVFIFLIPWVIILALYRHTSEKWQALPKQKD